MKKFLVSVLLVTLSYGCGGGIELSNQKNHAPFAVSDSIVTQEDTPVVIEKLTDNDSDQDSDTLSIVAFSTPANGVVIRTEDDQILYQPQEDFFGEDSFEYTVSDGHGSTHSASVSITVSGVNDPPELLLETLILKESMFGTQVSLKEYGVIRDIDSADLIYSLISKPISENFNLREDGWLTYTPPAGFEGDDSISFSVSDGEYTIEAILALRVSPHNDAPTAVNDKITTDRIQVIKTGNVLENDIDLDGDQLFIVSWDQPKSGSVHYRGEGEFVFQPNLNAPSGVYSFPYTISDGNEQQSTANIEIEILPGWGKPVTHTLFSEWSHHISDKEGNITVLWTSKNKNHHLNLFARRYDNNTKSWGEEAPIENMQGSVSNTPQVFVDKTGVVTVIWIQTESETYSSLYTTRFKPGSGWQSPKELSENLSDIQTTGRLIEQLITDIDDNGNIAFAWLQQEVGNYNPNNFDISYNFYSSHNENWGETKREKLSFTIPTPISRDYVNISSSSENIIVTWVDKPGGINVLNSRNINLGLYKSNQTPSWTTTNTISRENPSLGSPDMPLFYSDAFGNTDAIWIQTKPIEFTAGNPIETPYIWTAHFDAAQNTWLEPVEINASGYVLANTLSVVQMTDDNSIYTGDLFITWQQSTDNSLINPLLWGNAKLGNNSFKPHLANDPNFSLLVSSEITGTISQVKLMQSQDKLVAIWLQDGNIWSNQIFFDTDDLLTSKTAATIEDKNGPIEDIQLVADKQQNLTAIWTQDLSNTAVGKVSVMAQHYRNGGWTTSDSSFVSSNLNDDIDNLGAPYNVSVMTTDHGDVVVLWEHYNANPSDSRDIWTNTFESTSTGPKWNSVYRINTTTGNDSILHSISKDEDGRILALWSEFDGEYEQLWQSEYRNTTDKWQAITKLDIPNQTQINIIGLSFNKDNNPTITAGNLIPGGGSRTIWSIDYR